MINTTKIQQTIGEQTKAFSNVLNAQVEFAKTIYANQQDIIAKTAASLSKFEASAPGKNIEATLEFAVEHQKDYIDAIQKVQDALVAWNDLSWKHTEAFVQEQVQNLNKAGHTEAAKLVERVQENLNQGKVQVEAGKKAVEKVVEDVVSKVTTATTRARKK